MTARKYITLADSNNSKVKYFRVISEGYDDGTLNRAENLTRTIGGGFDHSIGSPYKIWSPTILVRESESVSGYGTASDLEYFYKLNNPNGVPTNTITFTDHHGAAKTVHVTGQMPKQCLGCMIEGAEAWFLYRLQLVSTTVET
jgi:hypothetical protein